VAAWMKTKTMYEFTCTSSKLSATTAVKSQLVRPAMLIARGLGPCLNSSAPIIIGIGPIHTWAQCLGWYKTSCGIHFFSKMDIFSNNYTTFTEKNSSSKMSA